MEKEFRMHFVEKKPHVLFAFFQQNSLDSRIKRQELLSLRQTIKDQKHLIGKTTC